MMKVGKKPWRIIRVCGLHRYVIILCVSAVGVIFAETYYIAPNGNDSHPGTIDEPFASLGKGCDKAAAGDIVYVRGGTYAMSSGITIRKSGSSDTRRIRFWAYQNERPVFDFSGIRSQTNGVTISNSEWLYFRGLAFCRVPQLTGATPNCVLVDHSSHIIFEQCEFHHNGGTGLFFAYGNGGHLVLNCDSHDNYDPLSSQGDGQNADGFGVHYQTANTDTTVVSGCRGWWNSDDGIDCIHQNTAVVFENSWFWLNGYKPGTMDRPLAGNGQGVKAGGYDLPPNRVPAVVPQNIV
ncbi:MAG: right-handed parallel beta-helix repeat-containing protein, partial [Chitinispirillaceae bacterium]|nr:right-handed parallel beta-helix repeat-containing protein [Chitinispirillaceae bacterium]